jgi:hypothetical protein
VEACFREVMWLCEDLVERLVDGFFHPSGWLALVD